MEEVEDKRPILLEDLGMQYYNEGSKYRARFGLYKCGYCGKEFRGSTYAVKAMSIKSCGCLGGEKHGLRNHKFYNTWYNMVGRCNNPKTDCYTYYGGRGITVCDSWQDIKNFVEWAESTYVEGMTLDRIDNDKGYSPDNCRWADKTTQLINQGKRRDNKSGYVGVSWRKDRNKWTVRIRGEGKYICVGHYIELEEAAEARDNYIISNNLPHKLSKDYIKKEEE